MCVLCVCVFFVRVCFVCFFLCFFFLGGGGGVMGGAFLLSWQLNVPPMAKAIQRLKSILFASY